MPFSIENNLVGGATRNLAKNIQQKTREIRGLNSFPDLIGGGEESRTPVQKHCIISFSECSLYFEIRSFDAYKQAS